MCTQWTMDLAEPLPVAERLAAWLAELDAAGFGEATLINNAGLLTRIGTLERCTNAELSAALRAGLEAPLVLTASFLRATAGWPARRRVLNISSGLGRRARAGAGDLLLASRPACGSSVARRAPGARPSSRTARKISVSLAPGVIDIDMQVLPAAPTAGAFRTRAPSCASRKAAS